MARMGARLDSGESPVSAYTDNRAAAETAARVAREVTGQHGLTAQVPALTWVGATGLEPVTPSL
jgi:hypothetical protein